MSVATEATSVEPAVSAEVVERGPGITPASRKAVAAMQLGWGIRSLAADGTCDVEPPAGPPAYVLALELLEIEIAGGRGQSVVHPCASSAP